MTNNQLTLLALLSLTLGWTSCTTINSNLPEASPQTSATTPQEIVRANEVRSLPGKLDNVPMFNSNSPEWVKKEGILLSTFPPEGKTVSTAHLNFPFQGKFTLFAHHFTHTPPNLQTLYLGVIVHNPSRQPVTLVVSEAASYLMEPDAPFQQQPTMRDNPDGEIYAGAGIRAVDNVLRGRRQQDFPPQLVIPPGKSRMLMNHPIPVGGLAKPINGRSSFLRLSSSIDTPRPKGAGILRS
ncbi:MAG: DUF3370 family protein [Symploca sp. SIO3E6]|nr:DUF3370 family protein [Caldora sp. SIO3E6]